MLAWIIPYVRSFVQGNKGFFYTSTISVLLPLYFLARSKSVGSLFDIPNTVAERVDETKNVDLNDTSFEYDVIIVGGGPAGCVLASRLSENPNVRILLVEAGGSSRKLMFSRIPAGFKNLFLTPHDFALFTEPQVHASNERMYWPRGKLLGGCTAMNAAMFHCGAPSDYDEWAKTGLDGAEEWSYQAFRKYFLKFERYNPHPDFSNVNSQERGQDGPVDTGYFGYFSTATKLFIKACLNLGIPENPDVNSPSRGTMGVTKIMTYIDKSGTRVTAESAYLTPEVLKRPNLKVTLFSTATRIIFDTKDGKKRAIGLEFVHSSKQSTRTLYRAKIKREVVLTAGAVHSPHLLLLSGVGPKDELEKHNIPTVHDLPGVGRNLQDHISVHGTFSLASKYSLQYLQGRRAIDKLWLMIALARWSIFGSGPVTTNTAEAAAFIRLDDSTLIAPDKYSVVDETSGPNAPDLEIISLPIGFRLITGGVPFLVPSMNVAAICLRPQSRGRVNLRSANPLDAPVIDPRYFEKQNDVAVLVKGFKLILKVINTAPLSSVSKNWGHHRHDYDLCNLSDEELEEEVKRRSQTVYHPTSTCRMAKLEDEGVVDARLRVHGLENVRVADAAVFPRIVSGHTTAPVFAVAEKAADMIKQDFLIITL